MHQRRVTYTVPGLTEERSVATLRELSADTQCLLLTGKLRLVNNMHRTSLYAHSNTVLSHQSSYAVAGQYPVLYWHLSIAVLLSNSYRCPQLLHSRCASHSHSVTGAALTVSSVDILSSHLRSLQITAVLTTRIVSVLTLLLPSAWSKSSGRCCPYGS
jgi:hypothetical protein